jgi:hypothetical protein
MGILLLDLVDELPFLACQSAGALSLGLRRSLIFLYRFDTILRLSDVKRSTGLSRGTIYLRIT